jgi:general stress protein 26
MNETEARVLGLQLMEVSEMVYLTTLQPDGYPHTRALWNLRNRKMFGRLYPLFREHKEDYLVLLSTNTSSNKVAQIEADPRVCAYYCAPQDSRGLTLIGDAEIVDDMEVKRALWAPEWEFYYPLGVEDPDFTVLALRPARARYYHRLDGCEWGL